MTAVEDLEEISLGRKLSHVPFNQILNLNNVIGSKEFTKEVFGNFVDKKTKCFKRENKNRPQEISSKLYPRRNCAEKKTIPRDPRFENTCGSFNSKHFENSYSFVNKIRKKERSLLSKQLKDPELNEQQKKNIVSLIQRINDSIKTNAIKKRKELLEVEEKQNQIEALKRGENPYYKKKSEKKLEELVNQYEELKNKGKLSSHIRRCKKKNTRKNKMKLMI